MAFSSQKHDTLMIRFIRSSKGRALCPCPSLLCNNRFIVSVWGFQRRWLWLLWWSLDRRWLHKALDRPIHYKSHYYLTQWRAWAIFQNFTLVWSLSMRARWSKCVKSSSSLFPVTRHRQPLLDRGMLLVEWCRRVRQWWGIFTCTSFLIYVNVTFWKIAHALHCVR